MEDQNSYSKVYQQDDNKAQELVNSYKFRDYSPQRIQKWNPETSTEKRYIKKRKREDEYMESFDQGDRPILLIRNKHAYKGLKNNDIFDTPDEDKEHYYKISENTQVVENIPQEILSQSQFQRKNTQVHRPYGQSQNEEEENTIYKIEGIEYLPEGFLELDPLHFKDEFKFESRIHEQLFDEEQRKIKALRRKQYQLKDKQKQRDVTIYVLDEHKDRVIDFLEQWYFRHKRRMNPQEIQYVSQDLQCEPELLAHLQDLFLHKQKILNTKHLRKYLMDNGRLVNNKLTIPSALRKYFVKSKNPYDIVESRVYKRKSQYSPYKKKQKKIGFSEKVFGKKMSSTSPLNYQQSQLEKNKEEIRSLSRSVKNSGYAYDVKSGMFSPERNTQHAPYGKMRETEIKMYFDDEINKILNTMQKKNSNYRSTSQLNKKSSLRNSQTSRKNQSLKKSVTFEDDFQPNYSRTSYTKRDYSKTQPQLTRYDVEKAKKSLKMKHSIKKSSPKPNFSSQLYDSLPQNYSQKFSYIPKKYSSQSQKKRQSTVTSTSIAYKDIQGNTNVVQKLQPIEVGHEYYYQTVEQTYNDNGEKRVTITTKNGEGIIINQKKYSIDKIGEIFQNKSYPTQRGTIIVVENENNEVIDTQEITNITKPSLTQRNSKFSFGDPQNPRGSITIQEKNKRTTILEPVFLNGQELQQVIVEEITPRGVSKTCIMTKNKDGVILSEDIYNGQVGKKFQTVIDKTQKDNISISKLKTVNENGDVLGEHEIKQAYDEILGEDFFDTQKKGTINYFQEDGEIVRAFTTEPIIIDNAVIKQSIIEGKNENGERSITIITKDLQGTELSRQEIPCDDKEQLYETEVIKQEQGRVSVMTKNDQGKVLSVANIRPTIFEVLGEEYEFINEFNQKSKGRSSYMKKIKKNKTEVKQTYIRPSVMANQYVQQLIEEVSQNGKLKKVSIITQDMNGKQISVQELKNSKINGEEFHTEIIPHETKKSIFVVLKNQDEKIISKQEIPDKVLQNYAKDFLLDLQGSVLNKSKKKNSIKKPIKNSMKKSSVRNSKILGKTIIGNQAYNQILHEIINEYGKQEATLITQDEQGNIIGAQNVDPQQINNNVKSTLIQDNNSRVSIVIQNEKGSILAKQSILQKNTIGRPSKTSILKNGSFKIKHSLRPTQIGNNFYQTIVEEIINEQGKEELQVSTIDQKGTVVNRQSVNSNLKGKDYKTVIVNDFVDQTGQRKVTLELRNNENKTLSTCVLRPTINEVLGEFYFDQINEKDLKKNNVEIIKKQDSTIVVKQLRPTLIGSQKLSFYFIEKDEGYEKKLTFVTKDEDNEIIAQESLHPQFISDNYTAFIESQEVNDGKNQSVIAFKNKDEQVFFKKKFYSIQDQNVLQGLGDVINNYDQQGKKISTVTVSRQGSKILKSHSLRPTQLGHAYYQQIILEEVQNGQKKITVLTMNEKGETIQETEVDGIDGENYYTEIVAEILNDDGQRDFILETKNENNQTIAQQRIRPTIMEVLGENYFEDEVLEEITNDKGEKKRSILKPMRNTLQVYPLEKIEEKSVDFSQTEERNHKEKYFEDLLGNYQFQNKTHRGSLNPLKESLDKRKHNTINVKQKGISQESQKIKQVRFGEDIQELPNSSNFQNRPKAYTPYPSKQSPFGQNLVTSEMHTDYSNHNMQDSSFHEDKLKQVVREVFQEERLKLTQDILNSDRRQFSDMDSSLQDEFFMFCKDQLPRDTKYKETMMFVNLFYYFLRKKSLIK